MWRTLDRLQLVGSRALTRLLDTAGNEGNTCTLELAWSDDRDQVHSDLLCRRIEGDDAQIIRHQLTQLGKQRIFAPQHHLVVPVCFEPLAQTLLDLGEVDDTPHPIQLRRCANKVNTIVVSVQVTALALVPNDTVPHTDIVVALYCNHIYLLAIQRYAILPIA